MAPTSVMNGWPVECRFPNKERPLHLGFISLPIRALGLSIRLRVGKNSVRFVADESFSYICIATSVGLHPQSYMNRFFYLSGFSMCTMP